MLTKERQIAILASLSERPYEVVCEPETIGGNLPMDVLCANLKYLHDCGYVKARLRQNSRGKLFFGGVSIETKGIAYFEENGGLYRKAAAQVIEVDQESFQQMLQAYIEASGKDKTVKARLLSAVKNAPSEALKTLAGSLIRAGLSEAPDAWQLLESTLFH